MEKVSIGGGHWLSPKAAASWRRCVAAGCPDSVTDAGRTPEEQDALRAKYEAGEGNFAWPSSDPRANHVGGNALDLPWGGRVWMTNTGAGWKNGAPAYNEWGWSGVENESWHRNYSPEHDKHLEDDVELTDRTKMPAWAKEYTGHDAVSVNDGISYAYVAGQAAMRAEAAAKRAVATLDVLSRTLADKFGIDQNKLAADIAAAVSAEVADAAADIIADRIKG